MTAPLPVLGVDPGRTGAAVLLGPTGALEVAWTWRPARGGSLRLAQLGAGEQHFVDPHDIGSALHWRVQGRGVARAVVVVEQLFVPRQASPATFLPLAEETGALVASLRPLGDGEVLRVLASQWRPAILGLRANVSSKAAEAAALAACRGGLVRGAEEVADPHLAEAAMIARWGWVQQCAAGRG